MTEPSNFEGWVPEVEHRTVGPHRAWCLNCGEWCYPGSQADGACSCCFRPWAEERIAQLEAMHADD